MNFQFEVSIIKINKNQQGGNNRLKTHTQSFSQQFHHFKPLLQQNEFCWKLIYKIVQNSKKRVKKENITHYLQKCRIQETINLQRLRRNHF